jgi:hypothetical protein
MLWSVGGVLWRVAKNEVSNRRGRVSPCGSPGLLHYPVVPKTQDPGNAGVMQ